jgi:hypothetical protein
LLPIDETIPSPVTTTRLMEEILSKSNTDVF